MSRSLSTPQAAHQQLVAAADDGGRRLFAIEELARVAVAPCSREKEPARTVTLDRPPVAPRRPCEAPRSRSRPGAVSREPPMSAMRRWPRFDEMPYRLDHARSVIVLDRAGPDVCGHLAIDEHDRHVHRRSASQELRCRLAHGGEQHAVDPPGLEEADAADVQFGVVLRVHQEQRVAGLAQLGLSPQHDVREQRVADVAQHEPDRERLAATQALGQEVRLVLELGDGGQDAVAHLGR